MFGMLQVPHVEPMPIKERSSSSDVASSFLATETTMSRASPELTVPWAIAMIGLGLGLGSLLLIYLIERYVLSVPYPPGVQLVREPVGARRFSLRTRLAYYTDCESLYREAYENVSLKAYIIQI